MFIMKKSPEFSWPVKVFVPDEGRKTVREFTGIFRTIAPSEVRDRLEQEEGDVVLTTAVWIGWDKIEDEDGNPVKFSDEARRAMLEVSYVRAAVMAAYFEATNGQGKVKN